MAEIVNRKKFIQDINSRASESINDTFKSFNDCSGFMHNVIGKELTGMELYEMSVPFSRSTLSHMKIEDLKELTAGTPSEEANGFVEVIMELHSIPEEDTQAIEKSESGDEAKIVAVKNAGMIKKAEEAGLNMIPVRITWKGPQSLYGLGIWSFTSREDLPDSIRSLNGKSTIPMVEPSVTTETIALDPRDVVEISSALDSILSVAHLTTRMQSTDAGDAAFKWALRSEEAGNFIAGMTDAEVFERAVKYGMDDNYRKKEHGSSLSL